jgi:hypothetical protein
LDTATYRPIADAHIVTERIVEGDLVYYVLKNPTARTYLRLEESDYNLWQLMDGEHTVKDLVVAHFMTHKTFA